MSNQKIKKFTELSNDIEDKKLEIDIEELKRDGFEIESIIDVFQEPEEKVEENFVGIKSDLTKKEVKRGDLIYITAMIKKSGTSMSSPAVQAVIKLRVVDIYHGLAYLNKVINQ